MFLMSVTHFTDKSVPWPCVNILSLGGCDYNFFCQLTIGFVHAPALDVAPPVVALACLHISPISASSRTSFLFPSYFEFSLKLNSSSSFSFTEERLACSLVNAHPLSRRRLQLTIVGFHHRHECAASLVMACQRIFFTPLSLCLSSMPSFSPPPCLFFYL